MGRYQRVYYESAVYHVTFRANNRQMILREGVEKEALLDTVAKFQARFCFKIYGIILMDNHVHMIMEVGYKANISKVMQAMLLSFSLKYRKKYHYVGHVWQGPFRSKPIMKESYILQCLEYLHDNPVRAGVVSSREEYAFSSARFYEEGSEEGVLMNRVLLTRYGGSSSGSQ